MQHNGAGAGVNALAMRTTENVVVVLIINRDTPAGLNAGSDMFPNIGTDILDRINLMVTLGSQNLFPLLGLTPP
jgi:hypothetical protein